MTSVKDHVELLRDLLVLCFLSIWTSTPKAKRLIWCQGNAQMSIFVTYFHIPWRLSGLTVVINQHLVSQHVPPQPQV